MRDVLIKFCIKLLNHRNFYELSLYLSWQVRVLLYSPTYINSKYSAWQIIEAQKHFFQ